MGDRAIAATPFASELLPMQGEARGFFLLPQSHDTAVVPDIMPTIVTGQYTIVTK